MQFLRHRVYADAAASTPLSPRAKKELVRLLEVFGNAGGIHSEAVAAKREVDSARASVAESVGAHPDEIIFTSGGTEANVLALSGVLTAIVDESWQPEVITSSIEHPSVLEPLRIMAKEEKIILRELPVDAAGKISLTDLKDSINENTVLVSIQLINSEIGTIQDIREIAKIIRHVRRERTTPALPLLFHVDASQAPLWLSLKVEKLGVDLMTLDGQKIMGPKGVGLLYAKRGTILMPLLLGGGQEHGLRSGTENVPLIGSFAVALEDAQNNVEKNVEKVSAIRDYLINELQKNISGAKVNGHSITLGTIREERVANNINISIPGLAGDMATLALDAEGIAASTRSACATGDEEPSHVLQALGLTPEMAKNTIRLTLLPSATAADARRIVVALQIIVKRYANVIQ